jgi:CRP-like cAMP-binding protein
MPHDRLERDARPETATFIRHLEASDRTLSDEERQVIDEAISHFIDVEADVDFVREHDRPTVSSLLVSGWACRYNTLADGRRQILALHISGDFVDLHSFPMKRMDHSVATLTRCRFAIVPHENLRRITEEHPHLTRQLWRSTLIDAAVLRQWLLGAGQRSAIEHAAHLICELYTRLRVVNLADETSFQMPLTQTEIGDALGISPVHTNRVIQELRRLELISLRGSTVDILDWEGLLKMSEFDPTYLGLEPNRQATS